MHEADLSISVSLVPLITAVAHFWELVP
jgi:hypothetical protein